MRECSLVVIFEVCALYTAVLLGQIEDVCAWCLHSAHVGYTQTHTHIAHIVTGSVVVLSFKWIFCCFHHEGKKKENITAYRVCVSATLMSVSG